MNAAKAAFLHHKFVPLLQKLSSNARPLWGKMTVQQMIEHFSDSIRIASGKTVFTEIVTPPERFEKLRGFLMSEMPFKENTANQLLPETPAPVKNASVEEAIKELKTELDFFFSFFQNNKQATTRNPFFGDLTFEQNIQLLHKHALHHLKQFGVEAA